MKSLVSFFFAFLIVTTAVGQHPSKANWKYRPLTLADAILHLKKIHNDSIKQRIISLTEEEFIGQAHFGLGLWIRNHWGLWRGGPLAKHFNALGIYHPDDMSGIILASYHRALRQQDWQLNQQVKHYQAYWQAANEQAQRLQNDPVYRATMQARLDSAERALSGVQLEKEKTEIVPGARIRVYIDYQCGLLGLGERTLLEGNVVRWVGDDIEMKIIRYVDTRKKGRVIKCNGVNNDIVMLHRHKNYALARP